MKRRLNVMSVSNDYVCTDDNEAVIIDATLKNINVTLPIPIKGKTIILCLKMGALKSVTVLSPSGTVHKPSLTISGSYTYVSDGIDWI